MIKLYKRFTGSEKQRSAEVARPFDTRESTHSRGALRATRRCKGIPPADENFT
jgi:hypothetical protein